MTWSAVGSWLGVSTSSLTMNNQAVGNLLIVEVINFSNSTVWATGLTGGGATWVQAGTRLIGSSNTNTAVVFFGTVTATGSATTSVTWSGATPSLYGIAGQEFHSTVGSWVLDQQGSIDQPAASGGTWASLTPSVAGELYFGYAADGSAASAGSTTGFIWNSSVDTLNDGAAYNVSCANAATAPVWRDVDQEFGIMVLVREVSWKVLQSASSNGASLSGLTATFPNGMTSGSKMLAFIMKDGAGVNITSVTDSSSNNFHSILAYTFVNPIATLNIYVLDTPAGDVGTAETITIGTTGGTANLSMLIQEVTGLATGSTATACLDGTAGEQISTTSPTGTPSYTSSAVGEYLVAFLGDFGNSPADTYTFSGLPWALDSHSINSSTVANNLVEYKPSTGGTESNGWTFTGGSAPAAGQVVVAFKLAGGGGATVLPVFTAAHFPPTFYIQRHNRKQLHPRQLAALLSIVGPNQFSQTLTAPVVATGNIQNFITKIISGTVVVTGTVTRSVARVLATVITLTAITARRAGRILTGLVTATTSATEIRTRVAALTATLTVTASTQRTIGRVLAAVAAVTGATGRSISRAISASIVATAATVRQVGRSLQTVVTQVGSLTASKLKLVVLAASVVSAAALGRQAGKQLFATVTVNPAVTRQVTKIISAVLTVSGGVARRITRTLVAAVAAAGGLSLRTGKVLAAAAAVTVSSATQTGKHLAAAVAVSAGITRGVSKNVIATVNTVAAVSVTKVKLLTLAAVTALNGNVTRQAGRVLAGTTVVTSYITVNIRKTVTGVAAVTAGTVRGLGKTIAAVAVVTASQSQIKVKQVMLTALAAMTGGTARTVKPVLIAQVNVTGNLVNQVRATYKTVSAVVPAVTRTIGKSITGVVSVTVSQAQIKVRMLLLSASMVVSGFVSRRIQPILQVSAILTGSSTRTITRTIQGTFAVAGQTARAIGRVFAIPVTVSGSQKTIRAYILAVSIATSATVQRSISKNIIIPVTVTAQVVRRLFKTVAAQVAAAARATTGNSFFVNLSAGVSVSVSVTAHAMTNLKDLAFKLGVATFQWVISSATRRWKV